jgi:hypothetical protein
LRMLMAPHLQYGQTALIKAAAVGHVDVMRLLLDNGAKIDAVDKVAPPPLPHTHTQPLLHNAHPFTP